MKQFNGYSEAKKAAQFTGGRLPAGAYVCKVISVKYVTNDWGDQLHVAYDVEDGEQKGFFKKQYDSNTSDDKKWKGVARINVPKDDGTKEDGWTKNAFARWTDSIEKSNPGYAWDWDENKWKGKLVGIIHGDTGTVIEGKEIVFTEARTACSVDDAKTGNFWEGYMKLKKKNGYTGNGVSASVKTDENGFVDVPEGTDEEIPF